MAAPVRRAIADRWLEQGGRHVHAGIELQNGENDSKFGYGTKFTMLATGRNATRNNRVILDVDDRHARLSLGRNAIAAYPHRRHPESEQPNAGHHDQRHRTPTTDGPAVAW